MDFTKTLIHWYSIYKRDLPWRATNDPYLIWLSEVIMQQTQVQQGLPYYEAFKERFPNVFELAAAPEHDVLKLWQGLGYYSRARNLHAAAQYIVADLKGVFPNTYKEIIKLKGVGDYTASAIASICFNEKHAVVDGNVYRVLSRYFGIDTPIDSTAGKKVFKAQAQALLPPDGLGEYNQAVMEFGSRQCRPKNPDCPNCPLSGTCMAFQLNQVDRLPVKSVKGRTAIRHFNYLVFISDDGRTILKQRTGKGIWQNLYEFPLIESRTELKPRTFVKHPEALTYVNGEGRVELYNPNPVVHKLSHQHLYTKFWILRSAELPGDGISIAEIDTLPVPVLIQNFIREFDFKALDLS